MDRRFNYGIDISSHKRIDTSSSYELDYDDISLLPQKCIVNSRKECDTSIKLGRYTFDMPVFPSNMKSVVNIDTCKYFAKLGWFYTMHRFGVDNTFFINEMKNEGLFTSISIGIKEESRKDIERMVYFGLIPDYITIDVANAYSDNAKRMANLVKEKFPTTFLIVGTIASGDAAREITLWHVADAIRVGIAGGHVCTTKITTGFYRPMVSTIEDCCQLTTLPIIADGGIKHSGDIAKAIACGASMVTCGVLFSGYDESAGDIIEINEKQYKEYYGNASEYNKKEKINIEGKKILVEYKGSINKLTKSLKENLQSSISYSGGKTLDSLRETTKIRIG